MVAGIAVVVILSRGGGNGNSSSAQSSGTGTSTGTPGTGTPAATPGTLVGRYTRPEDALAAYVQQVLGKTYAGPCPSGGQAAQGICSRSLYDTADLATYFLDLPGAPGIGEAILAVNPDGTWPVNFVPAPVSGATIAAGGNAVVYGAGDCLNVHQTPATSSGASFCLIDGTKARVVEGPTQADGKTWWHLQDYGWAVSDFLQPSP